MPTKAKYNPLGAPPPHLLLRLKAAVVRRAGYILPWWASRLSPAL